MHRVIRFLVKGITGDDARANAEDMLNGLAENHRYGIDYGSFFDEPGKGTSHFGARPRAVPLKSKEGSLMILQGMIYDFDEFKRSLIEVKKVINKEAADLYASSGLDLFYFHKVYEREFIMCDYEFVGPNSINYVLEDADEYWVVPCDIHT